MIKVDMHTRHSLDAIELTFHKLGDFSALKYLPDDQNNLTNINDRVSFKHFTSMNKNAC